MQNVFLTTLDIDFNPKKGIDKEKLREIIKKVERRPCCGAVCVRPSSTKGYHITIGCKIRDCCLCRLAFDDQVRFAKDSRRPRYAQNVLFNRKDEPITQYL